jgi:hypothetical protein
LPVSAGRMTLRACLASTRSRYEPGQQASDTAVTGGFTRPPFLYLACLLLGLALDRVLPLPLILPEAALIR